MQALLQGEIRKYTGRTRRLKVGSCTLYKARSESTGRTRRLDTGSSTCTFFVQGEIRKYRKDPKAAKRLQVDSSHKYM
jgi:hypothetical protein